MAKLFHAIVALGAGISASGCGGTVLERSGKPDEAAGGSGNRGGAGRSTGGPFGVGGVALGGSATGGVVVSGVPVDAPPGLEPLPDRGTVAQWNCTTELGGCDGPTANPTINPYVLYSACPVDSTRPRSAADCAVAQWFQCTAARYGQTDVLVNCTCAPITDAGCACPAPTWRTPPASCHGYEMTCGCAYTGILH